jgi:hypothetical protein
VVFSEEAYTREMVTFNKNLEKKHKEAESALWHLSTKEFACETDATSAIKRLIKELKFHDIQYQVSSKPHYATKGKPKADTAPSHYGWVVTGVVVDHQKKIQQATAK